MQTNVKINNVKPKYTRYFIKGYITEKNSEGKERAWGLELVTGFQIKIQDNRYYWLCTEPPEDLDYDCPPHCWNYRAPATSPLSAKNWFLKTFKVGVPRSDDSWIISEVFVVEGVTSNSNN